MPLQWYQRAPVVNLAYDLLFDEPPSVANVEKLLNVYGLISALLLSCILGFNGASINQRQNLKPTVRPSLDDSQPLRSGR